MSRDPGSRRRRLSIAAAALAVGGFALGAGVGSIGAAPAALPTFAVTYTSAKTIQVKLGDGTVVGSGAVIPAGSYMVLVYDDPSTDPNPKVTLSGPGIALSSDLNSTGMGIDQPSTFGPYTFQTSSSYSVQDTVIGASSLVSFTTSATATASGSAATTSSGGQTIGSGQSTPTTTSTSAGSNAVKLLGTLEGTVTASGKPALSFRGRAAKALVAGRYRITVVDHSKQAGLIVGAASQHTIVLSGPGAVGTTSHMVTLAAGRWFFATTARGPKTYFVVGK